MCVSAKLLQSCPTLCDPIDSTQSLVGSPVPGILQVRTLEWVAISFSNTWKWKVKVKSLSHVQVLVTPWTAAYQAPLSMRFSRQEYWSGVPLPWAFKIREHFLARLERSEDRRRIREIHATWKRLYLQFLDLKMLDTLLNKWYWNS